MHGRGGDWLRLRRLLLLVVPPPPVPPPPPSRPPPPPRAPLPDLDTRRRLLGDTEVDLDEEEEEDEEEREEPLELLPLELLPLELLAALLERELLDEAVRFFLVRSRLRSFLASAVLARLGLAALKDAPGKTTTKVSPNYTQKSQYMAGFSPPQPLFIL